MEKIKVLDHGFVEYKGHLGGEEDIIEAARQSTQKGFLGWTETVHLEDCPSHFPLCKCPTVSRDSKLLEYLYKNKHMTPFEMCELRVQIKAPIFIFREIHRHRTFSYNEMSGRYIQMPNEHYVPNLRFQDEKNKQSSITDHHVRQGCYELDNFQSIIKQEQDFIYEHYEDCWIANGVAKEVARINTPVSRYSIMWMKGNLRNWLAFLSLRDHKAAQWEMQEYARAIASIVKELWPRTYNLYEEYTKGAVTLSASEVKFLRQKQYTFEVYEEDQKMKGQIWEKFE